MMSIFWRSLGSAMRRPRSRSASSHLRAIESNFISIYSYSTQNRHWKCVQNTSPSSAAFTLMSYNILAQHHIDSQPSLYYNHNPKSLRWPHRFDALKREINDISPDILCLQEVQQNHLAEIALHFNDLGYDTTLFKKRTGLQVDGCAIFYKKHLFDLVEFHFVDYFQPNIKILNRCNVAIIAKLAMKSKPDAHFVVSTTHLLFNPKRHDIRLAQVQVLLAELDRIARDNTETHQTVPIILTGDFNIQQNSEVFQLIIGESVETKQLFDKMNFSMGAARKNLLPLEIGISDHCQHLDLVVNSNRYQTALNTSALHANDSKTVQKRTINNEDITKSKMPFDTGTIQHHLNLVPTIHTDRPFQMDTAHASTFHSKWIMVDYIFYSESSQQPKLQLLENYQLPTSAECLSTGPIPNEMLGSDHYSIAARFSIE